jgi:hypothetical protein
MRELSAKYAPALQVVQFDELIIPKLVCSLPTSQSLQVFEVTAPSDGEYVPGRQSVHLLVPVSRQKKKEGYHQE